MGMMGREHGLGGGFGWGLVEKGGCFLFELEMQLHMIHLLVVGIGLRYLAFKSLFLYRLFYQYLTFSFLSFIFFLHC